MTLPYTHLSLAERREIAHMQASKIPISVIADLLQRHRSTIYREIKRNWVHDEEPLYRGYYHVAADMQARARRQRLSKLSRKPVLAVYVMDRLKAGWSPEQIAGRLRASGAPERLSHETIYRFVYSSQGHGTPRKCLGYRTPKEVPMSSLDPGLPGLCNPDQLRPGSP